MMQLDHLRLSYSSIATFRSCARKLEFKKFYPLTARDESVDTGVGHALHAGYQNYLIHRDRDQAIFAMMLDYPIHLNSNPTHVKSVEACYPTLNAMMDTGAFTEYEIATVKCLDGETRPAIEVPFQIDLTGFNLANNDFTDTPIPVIYVGFIDAILYDKIRDEYIVIDIKSTRWHLNDMTAVYHFDEQCIPYAIVLERILGHALNSLTVKYMSVFVDITKPKVTSYEFIKNKTDVEDWARGLLVDLQTIKMYYNMQWFKRNSNGCVAFNRVCQFFEVCNLRDQETITEYLTLGQPEIKEMPFEPWIKLEMELGA